MEAARKREAPLEASGILPGQGIAALVEAGAIAAQLPVGKDQIQPASLDLRLGARAWRVRASFCLPRKPQSASASKASRCIRSNCPTAAPCWKPAASISSNWKSG
jgi:hypothetical protein